MCDCLSISYFGQKEQLVCPFADQKQPILKSDWKPRTICVKLPLEFFVPARWINDPPGNPGVHTAGPGCHTAGAINWDAETHNGFAICIFNGL